MFARGGLWLALFFGFFIAALPANAGAIIKNDGILSEQVVAQLDKISDELLSKTGVYAGVAVVASLDGASVAQAVDAIAREVKFSEFTFIFLARDDQKVEIYQTAGVARDFDKEQVLSPLPSRGTIIPILAQRKGKDIYNASMLNGFADIAEQIASSRGVSLESSIGNTNRNVIDFIRVLIYGSIIFVIGAMIYFKSKRKKGEANE